MYNGDGLNFTVLGVFVVIGLITTVYLFLDFLLTHLVWVN